MPGDALLQVLMPAFITDTSPVTTEIVVGSLGGCKDTAGAGCSPQLIEPATNKKTRARTVINHLDTVI